MQGADAHGHREEIVAILKGFGLWEDPDAWRFLSDSENNYSSIGNQGADAIAAFVENIINYLPRRPTDRAS